MNRMENLSHIHFWPLQHYLLKNREMFERIYMLYLNILENCPA